MDGFVRIGGGLCAGCGEEDRQGTSVFDINYEFGTVNQSS